MLIKDKLKKLLLVLFVVATIFTGCKKDTNPTVVITSTDIANINTQLRGTWLFPTQTVSVLDDKGKPVIPVQSTASSVFVFDGISNLTIMPDLTTVEKATYTLSTSNGYVFVTVLTPDGNTTIYKLLLLNDKTLKLNTSQPYLYYNGDTPEIANAVINKEFKKEDGADANGKLVNISISSDSVYNANLYVVRKTDTLLLSSQSHLTAPLNYAFAAKDGDHLYLDIFGSIAKTTYSVYYQGIPLSGLQTTVPGKPGEITTTSGWDIP